MAKLEGVYVPSLYEVTYLGAGTMGEMRPKVEGIPDRIRKRVVLDLDKSYYPTKPPVHTSESSTIE